MKALPPKFVRLLRQFHQFVAAMVGLILIVVATSGFLMTFRDQMLRAEFPHLFPEEQSAVNAQAVAEWIAAGEASLDAHAMVDSVYAPFAAPMPVGAPLLVRHLHDEEGMRMEVFAVTGAGGVEAVDPASSLSMLPTFLHTVLLAPRGEYAAFAASVLVVLGIISGVLVWWPGAGRIGASLSPSSARTTRRKFRLCHIWIGLTAAPVLLVILFSGQATWLLLWLREPPAFSKLAECEPPASWAERAAAVEREFPAMELASMTMAADGGAVTVALRPPASSSAARRGVTFVHVDRCGRVMGEATNRWRRVDDAVTPWLIPIHGGRILGAFGQTLVAAAALALIALLATGLWNWLSFILRKRV